MTVDDPTPTEREVAVAYLDAIRLANEGAADDVAFRRVVTDILERAPATPYPKTDTLSPRFLVEAIQSTQAELTVA